MENIASDNLTRQNAPLPAFSVIIVAGGSGKRLSADTPKQYITIGGQTILRHTVTQFTRYFQPHHIVTVVHPDHKMLYEDALSGLEGVITAFSGEERYNSVYNGLLAINNAKDDHIIVVHDAARPFIAPHHIENVIRAAHKNGAATLALPVASTLRHRDGHYVSRDGLHEIQTPQVFHYALLKRAHETCENPAQYTDDSAMVAALGYESTLVNGDRSNFKITLAEDIILAEQIIKAQTPQTIKVGSGFDVHAFAPHTGAQDSIILCGIKIPGCPPLAGHSDADVGLHALTDAILGALAAGDIGHHFPPSDPQWKGASSDIFLRHAAKMVTDSNGTINHLDLTLICEKPKIGIYRDKMREKIAAICNLSPESVSIKATTTEKLGFTGREEGIAAQATATLSLPADPRLPPTPPTKP